jgi:hypothetical protein
MSTPVKFVNKRAVYNNQTKKNALITQHLINISNAYKTQMRLVKLSNSASVEAPAEASAEGIFALGQFLNNAEPAPVEESASVNSAFALGQFLSNVEE